VKIKSCVGVAPAAEVVHPAVDFLGPTAVGVRKEGEIRVRFGWLVFAVELFRLTHSVCSLTALLRPRDGANIAGATLGTMPMGTMGTVITLITLFWRLFPSPSWPGPTRHLPIRCRNGCRRRF